MISEGPCIEEWSTDGENSALNHRNKLYFIKINVYLNRKTLF